MATIRRPCPACDREIPVAVGSRFVFGQLVWYASYNCPYCGARIEEDGLGVPPEGIRRAILAEDGEWDLVIPNGDSPTVRVLKVLRQALDLSLAEAGELRDRMPGVVATGTRAEMERLRHLLAADGLRADIRIARSAPPGATVEGSAARRP